MSERIRTETAAKILGAAPSYIVYKMSRGELPIGEYDKTGKKASVKIYIGKLARYLEMDREDLLHKINEIEGGEEDA